MLVVRCSVCVYVCYTCVSSTSSMACLLFVCLGHLLCLHSLCLVRSVYIYVCCNVPVLIVRCSTCVCVYYTYALSASFVVRLLFVCLGRLLCLRFLYLVHSVCVCVCCAYACTRIFFLLCQRCWFFTLFLRCKS